jgi:hypothetical protein
LVGDPQAAARNSRSLACYLSILDKSVIYVAAVLPRAVKFQRTPAETSKPRNSGLSRQARYRDAATSRNSRSGLGSQKKF